jgi:DNA-binding FrmR family transcriptional regulator
MPHHDGPVVDQIAKRLARLSGHAASLKRFWEEGRECEEMLTQISAVRSALDEVGKLVLNHHIERCVVEAIKEGDAEKSIKELKKALDRLV